MKQSETGARPFNLKLALFILSFIALHPERIWSGGIWTEPTEIQVVAETGLVSGVTRTATYQWKDLQGGTNNCVAKMVFLPTRNLLWKGFWFYEKFCIQGTGIVGIAAGGGGTLWFNTSTVQLPASQPPSEAVDRELSTFLSEVSKTDPASVGGDELSLIDIFGREVLERQRRDVRRIPPAGLAGVSVVGDNIRIDLEAENGNKLSLTLNRDLVVVAAMLNGQDVHVKENLRPARVF
jgi:hypothetical protein